MKNNFSRIKELRGSKSIREISRLTGIPATTIDRAESGDSDLKAQFIIAYCSTFGVSSDWILGLSDEKYPVRGGNNAIAHGSNGVAVAGNAKITGNARVGGSSSDEERFQILEKDVFEIKTALKLLVTK